MDLGLINATPAQSRMLAHHGTSYILSGGLGDLSDFGQRALPQSKAFVSEFKLSTTSLSLNPWLMCWGLHRQHASTQSIRAEALKQEGQYDCNGGPNTRGGGVADFSQPRSQRAPSSDLHPTNSTRTRRRRTPQKEHEETWPRDFLPGRMGENPEERGQGGEA